MYYGIPEKILSDQGRNFESDLIRELCHITGVKKLRTTPYRPQTIGQCEKFNSTLISMIGTLPIVAKQHWQGFVSTLVHAYNCTKSVATGFSQYFFVIWETPTTSNRYRIWLLFPQRIMFRSYKRGLSGLSINPLKLLRNRKPNTRVTMT